MRFFILCILTHGFSISQAFESKVSFSTEDMKVNRIVVGASGGDKDQMLTVAARIFQLQLEASKCEDTRVIQEAMIAAEKNIFSVSSKNCVIKNKKTEECGPGFSARNIQVNPRTPDDAIIGGELYKVCILEANGKTVSPRPAGNP